MYFIIIIIITIIIVIYEKPKWEYSKQSLLSVCTKFARLFNISIHELHDTWKYFCVTL